MIFHNYLKYEMFENITYSINLVMKDRTTFYPDYSFLREYFLQSLAFLWIKQ